MLKLRYALYAVLVVVVVGSALFVLSREMPENANLARLAGFSHATEKPWAPSPQLEAEANADFRIEKAAAGNVPLAGKKVGADWPRFAGPNRDNRSLETGLIPRWPAGGPKLAWISRGVGVGYSTVSVVDGVVYTMGNKGSTEAIIALDVGTGEKIWSTPIAWASHLSAGDGPRGTPTVSRGAVYGLGGNGDLACLDAANGKVRWQKNIVKEFGGHVPQWGICESVLVDGTRLICTPGGNKATLAALDPESGKVEWMGVTPDADWPGYASAVPAEVDGIRQYVQLTARGTIGLRAADGSFLWRDDSAANGTANCSSPLVAGDLVFSSSNYGTGGTLVKLAKSGSGIKAEQVYHTNAMKSHHGGMVIVDGLLYGSSDPGVLTCLELATGKVKWHTREVGKGSITYADGRLYVRSEQGTVALVEATGAGYRELGRFEQPNRSGASAWPHPVVAAGRLFLRDQDLLLCYDLKK